VRQRVFAVLALLLVAGDSAARAQDAADGHPERARPRVALALSGGGARGIAHIGALRALEEAGIPVDAIAANSMGSVVGAVYATGRTSAELEQIVRSLDWASLFSGRPDRRTLPVARRQDRYGATAGVSFDWKGVRLPGGILAEHRINRFLIENLSPSGYAIAGDFDALPIRFRAVAGDLATGEPVILEKGDLARAVRASLSIPVVFPPVEWEGKKLVDGMIVNNMPIDVAKAFGGAVLVAVDIGSPPHEAKDYESALGVASQVSDVLMRRRYQDFAAEADVFVRPDLGDHSATDYTDFDELIRRGYEAVKAVTPEIRAKLAAAGIEDLARAKAPPLQRVLEGSTIADVRVEGGSQVSDRLAGPPFDMVRGLRAFDKVDASDLFGRTWLDFAPARNGIDVVLRVTDAPPNRAEVSLGYTESEKAKGAVRLRNQNTLGFGEQVELLLAGSDAERVMEASLRGERLFVTGFGYRVTGYINRDKPRFFTAEGEEINRARFDRNGVDVALRAPLERWGLIEAGARFGKVATRPRGGLEELPETSDQVGSLIAQVSIDTLDDLDWPEYGQRLILSGDWSLDSLGADIEYWRAAVEYRTPRRLGKRAVAQFDGFAGLSGNDVPVYNWYRIGGVTLVPGYRPEELKGAQALAAAMSLRYRIAGQLRLVARGGAGNVFATTNDITLDGLRYGFGIGVYHPSPIGPVSFDFAVRDDGGTLMSLSVGWR
jgi:NTE family protein